MSSTEVASPEEGNQPKHIKIRTPELQEDGSVKYTTQSFYENLAHEMVEMEKHIQTSKATLLKDLISCLDSSLEIDLKIKYKHGEPVEIIKVWRVSKQSFNRK